MSKRTDALRRIADDMGGVPDGYSVREAAAYIDSIEAVLRSYQRAYGLIEEDDPDMRVSGPAVCRFGLASSKRCWEPAEWSCPDESEAMWCHAHRHSDDTQIAQNSQAKDAE